MSERVPPSNVEAEEALVGAALLRQQIVDQLKGVLDPSDFYKPIFQHAWEAMLGLNETGQKIDVITVSDAMGSLADRKLLLECQNATPAVSNAFRYADMIIEASRRRRLAGHYAALNQACYEQSADEVLAQDNVKGDRLIVRRASDMPGLLRLDEFIAQASIVEEQGEWLIPHIMRPRWRIVLVAAEGIGKGVLMRQLGLHVAAGRDPWAYDQFIIPRRVLYIDAENADTTILHQVRVSNGRVDLGEEAAECYHIWRQEAGINLRDRRAQADLEAVLQKVRPEIVFAGPLYKLFRRRHGDDMEQATIEMLEVLDDFRVRYNFALMVEHHAPKGSGGGYREMNPFGSSALLRWPEFGITLEAVGNPLPSDTSMTLDVGRFRRDREPADWPEQLMRGGMGQAAAWNARFANGRNRRGLK